MRGIRVVSTTGKLVRAERYQPLGFTPLLPFSKRTSSAIKSSEKLSSGLRVKSELRMDVTKPGLTGFRATVSSEDDEERTEE